MKKIINFIKYLKQNHIFLLIALIISTVLGVVPATLFLLNSETSLYVKVLSLCFLIPALLTFITTIIATKTFYKHPKITKFLCFCFNCFIIFFIQIFLGFMLFIYICFIDSGKIYTSPKDYQKALNQISHQERIQHFPKKIPNNASNIEFNQETCIWFGSEAILLKFNINSNYIENELKKYNYISIEKGTQKHPIDEILTNNNRIKIDSNNVTLYIINDRENENLEGHHFPYHYGIGVDKTNNSIFYYYTLPD